MKYSGLSELVDKAEDAVCSCCTKPAVTSSTCTFAASVFCHHNCNLFLNMVAEVNVLIFSIKKSEWVQLVCFYDLFRGIFEELLLRRFVML